MTWNASRIAFVIFGRSVEAVDMGLALRVIHCGPQNVKGIEINPYAAELARTSIWIGNIQWLRRNGFEARKEPVLETLDAIECRDALVTPLAPPSPETRRGISSSEKMDGRVNPDHGDGEVRYEEAQWPEAEFIVGNPPFLGASKFKREMGDEKTTAYRTVYRGRIPGTADLFCYWFEKAHTALQAGVTAAVGLVAKNTTTQGTNWPVFERITQTSNILSWWKDQPWVNEGAAVRVELLCFSLRHTANPNGVDRSQTNATSSFVRLAAPSLLLENRKISFQGSQKIGSFDIPGELAREWLLRPNPNGLQNSDVIKPLWNGLDITRRPRDMWVIDFGTEISEREAALYELPFEYALAKVKPERATNNREAYRRYWWRHGEPRVALRAKLQSISRYAAISEKS